MPMQSMIPTAALIASIIFLAHNIQYIVSKSGHHNLSIIAIGIVIIGILLLVKLANRAAQKTILLDNTDEIKAKKNFDLSLIIDLILLIVIGIHLAYKILNLIYLQQTPSSLVIASALGLYGFIFNIFKIDISYLMIISVLGYYVNTDTILMTLTSLLPHMFLRCIHIFMITHTFLGLLFRILRFGYNSK